MTVSANTWYSFVVYGSSVLFESKRVSMELIQKYINLKVSTRENKR